jgi:hypothetical protein
MFHNFGSNPLRAELARSGSGAQRMFGEDVQGAAPSGEPP